MPLVEGVPLCLVELEEKAVESIFPPVGNFCPCFGVFCAISFFPVGGF